MSCGHGWQELCCSTSTASDKFDCQLHRVVRRHLRFTQALRATTNRNRTPLRTGPTTAPNLEHEHQARQESGKEQSHQEPWGAPDSYGSVRIKLANLDCEFNYSLVDVGQRTNHHQGEKRVQARNYGDLETR